MNPAAAPTEHASTPAGLRESQPAGAAVLGLFAGAAAVTLANEIGHFWPVQLWLNPAFVVLALLASIAALAPALPWPNVLLAAGVAAFVSGMACAISSVTGFPLGRFDLTPGAGPLLLGLVPWWLPVMWAVIALSARGTARLLLHASQNHPHHGYRAILLATALAMLTSIAFQAFATHSGRYWTPAAMDSWFHSSGHVLHLFIQGAITPLVLDKFPGPRPRNFRPLLVLVVLNTLFAVAIFLA
jgi:uncharacterized membrane protein